MTRRPMPETLRHDGNGVAHTFVETKAQDDDVFRFQEFMAQVVLALREAAP